MLTTLLTIIVWFVVIGIGVYVSVLLFWVIRIIIAAITFRNKKKALLKRRAEND
ncbi:hypothetical protein VAFE106499_06015 [Vagococcus fessus]